MLHPSAHIGALFFYLQRRAARAAPSTTFTLIRKVGGVGLLPLGILDGSVIPTFGSLDLLTAWLSARDPDLWPYYAGMATVGAFIGAWITYRMGRRARGRWLSQHIGVRRTQQITSAVEHWGAGEVMVSTLAPPPFPAALFFLAAGAAQQPARKFAATVLVGRAIRYSVFAAIAAHYGRRILRYFRHPAQFLVPSLAITAVLILIAAVFLFSRRRMHQVRTAD